MEPQWVNVMSVRDAKSFKVLGKVLCEPESKAVGDSIMLAYVNNLRIGGYVAV